MKCFVEGKGNGGVVQEDLNASLWSGVGRLTGRIEHACRPTDQFTFNGKITRSDVVQPIVSRMPLGLCLSACAYRPVV